jgi:hypothetical protein
MAFKKRINFGLCKLIFLCILLFSNIAYPNESKKKKAKDDFPSPTFVEDAEVSVIRGGKVKIPLTSKPLSEETHYFFRTQPSHGTLRNLVVTKSGAAFVEYFHNDSEGVINDEFYFAAQRPGSTVSSRARVVIQVRERPPKLEVISSLDFGDVPISSTQTKSVQIKNTGGLPYRAKFKLPSSTWGAAENGRQIEILPGKTLSIPITFKPEIPGKFQETIKLEGEGGASVDLIGRGYEVFRLNSHQLRLVPDVVNSNKRKGAITITNTYNTDIDIYFKTPNELEPIDPIKLPILGSESVIINARKDIKKGSKCEVWIHSLGANEKIDISIMPMPPHLIFDPVDHCDFGKISKNTTCERQIKITNTGGSAANLNVIIPEWIQSIPNKYSIQSGESLNLLLRPRFDKIKENDIIKFNYDGIEKSISTKIYASEINKSNTIFKSPPKEDPDKLEPPDIDLNRIRSNSIRVLEARVDNGSVKIVWKDPFPAYEKYFIEKLEITSLLAFIDKQIRELEVMHSLSNTKNYMQEREKLIHKREAASHNNRVLEIWHPINDSKFDVTPNGDKVVTFAAPKDLNRITIRLRSEQNSSFVTRIEVPINSKQKSWVAPKKIILLLSSLLFLFALIIFFRKYKIKFS